MILPNKLIPFEHSIIAKTVYILNVLQMGERSIDSLNELTKNYFEDINQYILTLDVLFVLGKVQLNKETGVIIYVKTNNV